LIWSKNLYAKNLIVVGGFKGKSTSLFLERIDTVTKIHVYEPVPSFFAQVIELFANSKVVTAFEEAVYDGADLTLELSGDASLIAASGRNIPSHLGGEGTIKVGSVSIERAITRILDGSEASEYSLFMNCEGSEYFILDSMLKHGRIASSIIVQTHTTNSESYEKLYDLRSSLARKYMPVFTADWAWDVWIRRDLVDRSVSSIEQDAFK
jgi:FkbM family methyltransferase